ncbi:MAG: M23 family metallopeptidase [Armatimonadota bacterium]
MKRTRTLLLGLTLALAAISLTAPSRAAPARPVLQVRLTPSTLRQGEVAWLTVRAPRPMAQLRVRFAGRSWPVYPAGESTWRTVLGTDPTTPPGRQAVVIEAVTAAGTRLPARNAVTIVRVSFLKRQLTFDPEKSRLLTPEAVTRERTRVRAALSVLHPEQLWDGAFAIPLDGPISSPYGVLSIYQGQVRGFHSGTDIAAPEGAPVRTAADGIVRLAEMLPLSGNAVLVDHGLGVVTSYLHLSEVSVYAGQRIKTGDAIGRVGSTGLATGPHLHWGLRVNGVRVDPLPWTKR